ncbi:HNH endonuclease [Ruminococcaceae bacterium FB2012]|nr:HNH endonuclease [Ruminococcaceae bacterium FB2012]
MANRDFSDSVKLSVVTENLRKHNGSICCDACGIKLLSINDCHFDHIVPYAKGGKNTAENCQILCVKCNLKKTDKELNDFLLEEKARKFLAGEIEKDNKQETNNMQMQSSKESASKTMTKELFDQMISDFISRKGDIHKVDFGREYNHLPSIHYVKKYYGDLYSLKEAFGIEDLSANWNRETIKNALEQFIEQNGNIFQKDLTKKNNLPSLPCILRNYPEYGGLTDLKKNMFKLTVRMNWDKDTAIQAGKDYVEQYGNITESCLNAKNGLPTARIIYNYFGTLAAYQQAVGSAVSTKNVYISEKEIDDAVNLFFKDKKRIVESAKEFFKGFPYSPSTIHKRFGTFEAFCKKYSITVLNYKKAKYSKQEVDDAISKWIKDGKDIPTAKELSQLGLPSMSVILKYYENWKEPFVLYKRLFDKLNK